MGILTWLIVSTTTDDFNFYQKIINHTIPLNSSNDLELDLIVNGVNNTNTLITSTNVEDELGTEDSTENSINDLTVLNSTSILSHLLGNPRFLFFLFITLLISIVKSVCSIYLFLYLSGANFIFIYYLFIYLFIYFNHLCLLSILETFHASGTLMGLCSVMGISLEIICLNYAKELMELFGTRNMMILGQLALIIRVGLYGFLGKNMKSWLALPIELVIP